MNERGAERRDQNALPNLNGASWSRSFSATREQAASPSFTHACGARRASKRRSKSGKQRFPV